MKSRRAYILLYFLVIYVFAQLCWWGFSMFEAYSELSELKGEYYLTKVNRMLLGEGSVFLVILILAVWYIRKVIKKEIDLSLQQQNFLLAVTHELKTPIASSKLNTQTFIKNIDKLSREQKEKLLSNTNQDLKRLDRLVENILVSTKLQAESDVFLDKKKINLNTHIHKVISLLPNTNNIERVKISDNMECSIIFDEDSLTSILLNLIENALKYSQKDVFIRFNQSTIEVIDQGNGVKDKTKIFDQFYREENEETRTSKGSGLGLFIVKKLCEINNASILIKDNHPSGSIFVVNF